MKRKININSFQDVGLESNLKNSFVQIDGMSYRVIAHTERADGTIELEVEKANLSRLCAPSPQK